MWQKTLIFLTSAVFVVQTENYRNEYRLANLVRPVHYDLKIILKDLNRTTETFGGYVRIQIQPTKDVSGFSIHMENIEHISMAVYRLSSSANLIEEIAHNSTTNQYHIRTSQLYATDLLTFECRYTGTFSKDLLGFYKSSYITEDGDKRWIATTQLEQSYSRRVFPCFDEPNLKATFKLEIVHPASLTALSNTKGTIFTTDTMRTTSFEKTPLMSTYLLAFVISDFQKFSKENSIYNVWATVQALPNTQFAYEMIPKCIEAMETLTTLSYAGLGINKEALVAIPDFSFGAMENWGLATFKENYLLYNADSSALKSQLSIASIIQHEIAHTWFGNFVTLDWWSFAWLNEGFAKYYQYFATSTIEPTWELDKQFVVDVLQTVMTKDASRFSKALNSEANTPAEVVSKFDQITYDKGASVIRMLYHVIGKDGFEKGIAAYLLKYKYENVVPENLYDALQTSATTDVNITEFMTKWTDEAGFPVITVSLNGEKIEVKQNVFLENATLNANENRTLWPIPLTYTILHDIHQSGNNFSKTSPRTWLKERNMVLGDVVKTDLIVDKHAGLSWIIFNTQQTGYYRVNYDDELWNAIEASLKNETFEYIPALNRAQIVDDALALARSGYISYKRAFGILEYLEKETDYYPWVAAIRHFEHFRARFGNNATVTDDLNKFALRLMSTLYKHVQPPRNRSDTITPMDELLHSIAISEGCKCGEESCVKDALLAFEALKVNNTAIQPNIRSTAYCVAIAKSDTDENWNFLWRAYLKSDLPDHKNDMLNALGCTRNQSLIQWYLQATIEPNSGIRKHNSRTVFESVVRGSEQGLNESLHFLINNYDAISSSYASGLNVMESLFATVGEAINDGTQLKILEDFLNRTQYTLGIAKPWIEAAIETAQYNLRWAHEYEDDLNEYFNKIPDKTNSVNMNGATFSITFVCLLSTLINFNF